MEVRVFMELEKKSDGTIAMRKGGGCWNNGQIQSFDSIADAIKDLEERIAVEYTKMLGEER